MNISSLVLCLAGVCQGQTSTPENLDFRKGNLAGWHVEGFYLTTAAHRGPGAPFAVCSSDAGSRSKKGTMRYSLTVPPQTSAIRFSAYAGYGLGQEPQRRLNVRLLIDGEHEVPKRMRRGSSWVAESGLAARVASQTDEYSWDVANLVGQKVQIVLTDDDDRPGCFIYCTGFALAQSALVAHSASPSSYADFATQMLDLKKKHNLPALARYDTKRFVSVSTAPEAFTSQRLRYCEAFFDLFYAHFEKLGFAIKPPAEKLMVAVFDSHDGFEAYLGRTMPPGVTGVYHPGTNRLVLYDLRVDPTLLASKDKALEKAQHVRSPRDKKVLGGTIERQFDDLATDINLATTMHEAAHQMSFNVGLLNRNGDVPLWLAEGLACYCEATDEGSWQALGSPNPGRIDDLRTAVKKNGLIPLTELARSDRWIQTHPLLGYAQSWALFRMLLHERPKQMREYLELIYSRRTSDHRTTDFLQVFGGDLETMEQRYRAHLRELIDTVPPQKLR